MQLDKWYKRPSAGNLIGIIVTGGGAIFQLINRQEALFAYFLSLLVVHIIFYERALARERRQGWDKFIDEHFNDYEK